MVSSCMHDTINEYGEHSRCKYVAHVNEYPDHIIFRGNAVTIGLHVKVSTYQCFKYLFE